MIVQQAMKLFKQHQNSTLKKRTLKSYGQFMEKFQNKFSRCDVAKVTPDRMICKFLEGFTTNLSRATRHLRYAQMKAFFTFCY